MEAQRQAWPEVLTELPESDWPPRRPDVMRPAQVWRSREYLALMYPEAPLGGELEVRRLTVNRVTIQADGDWEQNIPWEDLQRIKRECGYGDWWAVEIYPRERDVVRTCNMRHLWMLPEPLDLGWFRK